MQCVCIKSLEKISSSKCNFVKGNVYNFWEFPLNVFDSRNKRHPMDKTMFDEHFVKLNELDLAVKFKKVNKILDGLSNHDKLGILLGVIGFTFDSYGK